MKYAILGKSLNFMNYSLEPTFTTQMKILPILPKNWWKIEFNFSRNVQFHMKTRLPVHYEIFLQWKTQVFSSESYGPPTFWILPKLSELCESCPRNSKETLQ